MHAGSRLGEFLRSRRHRLDPARLGLPNVRRRRTPGLRREEVAHRAGISCEWYVKLEQGRVTSASPETIAALARALVLDAAESAHLRELANGHSLPAFVRETVPEIVARIVEVLPEPAYVTGARWDVLAWNAAAEHVFGFGSMKEADRNILLFMFLDSRARELFGEDWPFEAQRMMALFRVVRDQRQGDAAFEALVGRLMTASEQFATWWASHHVRSPSAGVKMLRLEGRSPAAYEYASFQSNDDPALKLALYRRAAIPTSGS